MEEKDSETDMIESKNNYFSTTVQLLSRQFLQWNCLQNTEQQINFMRFSKAIKLVSKVICLTDSSLANLEDWKTEKGKMFKAYKSVAVSFLVFIYKWNALEYCQPLEIIRPPTSSKQHCVRKKFLVFRDVTLIISSSGTAALTPTRCVCFSFW